MRAFEGTLTVYLRDGVSAVRAVITEKDTGDVHHAEYSNLFTGDLDDIPAFDAHLDCIRNDVGGWEPDFDDARVRYQLVDRCEESRDYLDRMEWDVVGVEYDPVEPAIQHILDGELDGIFGLYVYLMDNKRFVYDCEALQVAVGYSRHVDAVNRDTWYSIWEKCYGCWDSFKEFAYQTWIEEGSEVFDDFKYFEEDLKESYDTFNIVSHDGKLLTAVFAE